eukprot:5323941-Prymnesium_polylepis.2
MRFAKLTHEAESMPRCPRRGRMHAHSRQPGAYCRRDSKRLARRSVRLTASGGVVWAHGASANQ